MICSALNDNDVIYKTCKKNNLSVMNEIRRMILLHENTRLHTAKITLEIISSLGNSFLCDLFFRSYPFGFLPILITATS